MQTIREFLQTVVTTEHGLLCMALRRDGRMIERWVQWPDECDKAVALAEQNADEGDVYFTSYLYKSRQSTKDNALPTRTIQADLDDADINRLPCEPSVLIETSPGRHQAYWILDNTLSLEEHERLSRKITYAIELCDRSGWSIGHKVRVPLTFNHKYLDGPKQVKIVNAPCKTYDPSEFETLPEVATFLLEHFDDTFIEDPHEVDTHPLEILDSIKSDIPTRVYLHYGTEQADRSEALWDLMTWAFKAGKNRNEVFKLAKHSKNNKFADRRYRADQDLAKDVLRAQFAVNSRSKDAKMTILDIQKKSLADIEKKRQTFQAVLRDMQSNGEFFHDRNGNEWYILKEVGRPVPVIHLADKLLSMLDIRYGLNATEPVTKYVAHALHSMVTEMPENAHQGSLSLYDPRQQHMLLHTGRRDVLRITSTSTEHMVDGAYRVIFPWLSSSDPFSPVIGGDSTHVDWGEEIFGNGTRGYGSSLDNIINMQPSQATALLKAWFMFVLFRSISGNRPIIATFGQPGSGKTTLFRKVYVILYGRTRSLSGVSNMEDFDMSVSSDPLVIIDNVDTPERWLPDRIALSAGTSDITKRKLYSDLDVITLRRQAIVGVTAHNPKFGREDVADRFLLFLFKRIENFVSEELIYDDLNKRRNLIWGAIVRDIQKIISSPFPTTDIPQFRIEDFARVGLWITRAIGMEDDFRSALEEVKSSQQVFTLEEDSLLTSAITKFAERTNEDKVKYYKPSQLWSMLEMCTDDARIFDSIYKNAMNLNKKLMAMQNSLSRVVDITYKPDTDGGRSWYIGPKGSLNGRHD